MIRRDLLKSSLATMVCTPALPAATGIFPRLGTTPIHTESEFRKVLAEYIDAYRDWRLVPHHDYNAVRPFRDAWLDVRERLRAMVLDNHGIDREGIGYEGYNSPMGLASRMIDLGDILIIAAVEAEADDFTCQCTNMVLVPRSREMFELLDGFPKEDVDEEEQDEVEPANEDKQDAGPSVEDVKSAILEAWEADQHVIDQEEKPLHDGSDDEIATLVSQQRERWENVRKLALRYSGLPEDHDEDVALKIGIIPEFVVVVRGSGYDYAEPDFSMERARCEVWDFKRA